MGETVKLLTLDVWDTILRRQCDPDETKLCVARIIFLTYNAQLKPEYNGLMPILRTRQAVERDIGLSEKACGNDDEYTLFDVCREWTKRVLKDDVVLDDAAIKALVHYEIAIEETVSYLDHAIMGKLQRIEAEKTGILSDFYMDGETLGKLITKKGFGRTINYTFVSCELKKNKRSGRAFKEVHTMTGIQPHEHIHIGDNAFSDVEVARKTGVNSMLFDNPQEEKKRAYRKKLFTARTEGNIAPYGEQLAEQLKSVTVPEQYTHTQKKLFKMGKNIAPFLYFFVLQVIESALQNNLKTVYYCTREGEFFKRIHETIVRDNPLGIPLPKAEIIEVSRLATFCASLQEVSTKECMRIWNMYSTQSMKAFFKTIDVDAQAVLPLLEKYKIPFEDSIQYPWQDERVLQLFRDADFQKKINTAIMGKRLLLKEYLAQKGITGTEKKVIICDIGWRGTIQDNLALIFPHTQIIGHYIGLQPFLNPQPQNAEKYAYGPDTRRDHPHDLAILNSVAPIEMMCNGTCGTTIGYQKKGKEVVAIKENNPAEDYVWETYIRYFQEGILAAAPTISRAIRTHSFISSEWRAYSMNLLHKLIFCPPHLLTKAYFSLSHNETFGVGKFIDKKIRFPFRLFVHAQFSKEELKKFKAFVQNTGWVSGCFTYFYLYILNTLYRKKYIPQKI